MVPERKGTLRLFATRADGRVVSLGGRMAANGKLDVEIPVRLLGPGPIILRIDVRRDGNIVEQHSFQIDRPSADFDSVNWRV